MIREEIRAQDVEVGMQIVFGTVEESLAEPERFAPHAVTEIERRINGRNQQMAIIHIERVETWRSAGLDVDGTWTRKGSFGRKISELVTIVRESSDEERFTVALADGTALSVEAVNATAAHNSVARVMGVQPTASGAYVLFMRMRLANKWNKREISYAIKTGRVTR